MKLSRAIVGPGATSTPTCRALACRYRSFRAAVSDAVSAHAGGRVVIVGHALAIMAYLCDVLRVEFGALRLLPYYTSVNIVRVLGERRMVGSLADVAHLEG